MVKYTFVPAMPSPPLPPAPPASVASVPLLPFYPDSPIMDIPPSGKMTFFIIKVKVFPVNYGL